jgi:exodeoxyribonuclease VII large subunit
VAPPRIPDPARPADGGPPALSVTEFYSRVDRALRSAFTGDLWITGEIRSMKVLPKGHCFIDLVDPSGARDSGAPTLNVKCWSGQWRRIHTTLAQLGIELDAGMVVRVRGEVQFYKARGSVDFILAELDTDALLGKVAAERARLVKALLDEGLYDRNRRLPVATPPLRVGLVASPGTEGCNDFLGRLVASGMAFDVRLVPTQVQGREAPAQVAAAIAALQSADRDVIVVVRGGGSKSDLATFDTEPVARAVAGSGVPVWTGIGHTGDQSVADEVANRAFITPTECGQELARRATECWASAVESGLAAARLAAAAVERSDRHLERARAQLASGARMQLGRHDDGLGHRQRRVRVAAEHQLAAHATRLATRGGSLARLARRSVEEAGRLASHRTALLATLPSKRLELEERQAAQWRRLLGAYDYQRQLERGYSVTRGPDGAVLRSAATVVAGDALTTRLADGELTSVVAAAPASDDRPEGEDPR